MLLESIADGVVATQGGGAGGAAAAAVPEAAAAAAAERTAQMCNDAALFLREWERSDPHEAKAGVGAALRTLLVSHEFLAMLRAIGAGDTRTLEALGRLDFLPPNPAAVEEHRAAFRGLGVPVFALHRAPCSCSRGRCACSTPTTARSRPPPTGRGCRSSGSAPRR